MSNNLINKFFATHGNRFILNVIDAIEDKSIDMDKIKKLIGKTFVFNVFTLNPTAISFRHTNSLLNEANNYKNKVKIEGKAFLSAFTMLEGSFIKSGSEVLEDLKLLSLATKYRTTFNYLTSDDPSILENKGQFQITSFKYNVEHFLYAGNPINVSFNITMQEIIDKEE